MKNMRQHLTALCQSPLIHEPPLGKQFDQFVKLVAHRLCTVRNSFFKLLEFAINPLCRLSSNESELEVWITTNWMLCLLRLSRMFHLGRLLDLGSG